MLRELELKVGEIHCHVAEQPQGAYHSEVGRPLAERPGYRPTCWIGCQLRQSNLCWVDYFFDLAARSSESG